MKSDLKTNRQIFAFFHFVSLNLAKKILLFLLVVISANPAVVARMTEQDIELKEITVRPEKEKYSKKNNPAVNLVDSLRVMADRSDPRNREHYNFNKYEIITIALNDISDSIGGGGLMKQFEFLNEFVDTSAITGKPILPVSVKEKVSEVFYRKTPRAEREYIVAVRRNGLDDIISQENVQTYLNDVFREIDLYQNDINILENRFVSPLSRIGPDFYKYYLTDTVKIDGELCSVLSFVPRNNAAFGFVGKIYVPLNEDNTFIKKIEMSLSKSANVNFVKSLKIEQNYERGIGAERLKTADIMTIEFEVISGTQGLYVQRSTKYKGHRFSPSNRPELFDRDAEVITSSSAYLHDDSYWDGYREGVKGLNNKDVGAFVERMRNVKIYRVAEKVLQILVGGYVRVGHDSPVYLGPVNTLLSFNDIEGARFRVGGLTTASLNPRLFGSGYVAYGTKDRKFKYKAELEYSFLRKSRHAREFPVNSLRVSYQYDIDHIGQDYAFTNADNFFLSLKRTTDSLAIYRRQARLEYMIEFENRFSLSASVSNVRDEATRFVLFRFADGSSAAHLDRTQAAVTLRYAPGETYFQTATKRLPASMDAPIFILTHTFAPDGLLGNRFALNKTEFNFQKRFWFSAFGYADVMFKAAHVWSKSPFINLLSPNSNISYTIQPESFDLVNPMEFVNDTQVSLFLTYFANGAILNYIPLVKKLKWREVFSIRAAWGSLSDRNNPAVHPELPLFPTGIGYGRMHWSEPYAEVAVGLDNILRILRVDYVWRLTYRDNPGISRSGLRIALHFRF